MHFDFPRLSSSQRLWFVGLIVAATVIPFVAVVQAQTAVRPVPGAPSGVTAFVNVTAIPMNTERVLPNQTVLVKGGRIVALGPANKVAVPPGAIRIDGRGQYLIPGLADMHTHLALEGADSLTIEQRLFDLLAAGATTVRNMDWMPISPSRLTLQFKARAAAGELWSPRIYTAGPWFPWSGSTQGASSTKTLASYLATIKPESVATYLAAYKAQGYDFIKSRHEPPTIFDSLLVIGRRLGLLVAGHVPFGVGNSTIEQALVGRMGSIEHLTGYDGRLHKSLDSLPSSDSVPDVVKPMIAALAGATRRAGVWNSPTYALITGHNQANLYDHLIKALRDSGAGLLLGTDVTGAGLASELGVLVTKGGLTPYQALVMGTRNPAVYFGTLNESGTITVGKRADLVLLRGNPLLDIKYVAQPAGVMVGGRWLAHTEIDRVYWRRVLTGMLDRFLVGFDHVPHENQQVSRQTFIQLETQATLDLLGSVPSGRDKGDYERIYRLLAQRLGVFRTTLTSTQRAAFDSRVRSWLQDRISMGYNLAVSGIEP